jgi:hypothetical protein
MQSIRARTPKEFLHLLSPNGKLFSDRYQEYIFRGQADASWPIIPRVLRIGTVVPYQGARCTCPRRTNRDQINVELDMMRDFGKTLNRAGHYVPYEEIIAAYSYPMQAIDEGNRFGRGEVAWPPRAYHPLIALAQHNGLPTRFVDFTYSAEVAAYFAVSDALKRRHIKAYSGDLAVYAIAGLSGMRTHEFGGNPIEALIRPRKRYCYQLIEAPTYFNGNLEAQKACFLAYLQVNPEKNAPCEIRSLEDYFLSCWSLNITPRQATCSYPPSTRSLWRRASADAPAGGCGCQYHLSIYLRLC